MSAPRFADTSAIKLALLGQQADGLELLHAEPIAVIGIGCRFPGGANDPDAYWQLLAAGGDAIREVPPERWNAAELLDADPAAPGKMTTRWGGFLDQVDRFDAGFFGISPREAARMDPQQRLLLEVAHEALDDAGQTRERLAGRPVGVFVGSYNNDYAHLQLADFDAIDAYTSTGTAHSIVANRLSYLLHLQGPSLAIDSACSSSLVAVHLACQSLRLRESSMAVAGGVSLILAPEQTVSLSKWGFMTPDGRCKTFDARANGFVRGEGAGVVVLKRLADALVDGDRILGVIRGSAVNQDGRTSVLTAPSGLAQQAVIRQALSHAQVRPDDVTYIEAHGTGTILGDPIEVEALKEVLGAATPGAAACALASAKTNIGHLEAAAGIAGLIKVLLCMRHGVIPPHLHFEQLNPNINFEGTRFFVPTEPVAWPADRRRIAGVSSFGFGGTNAHVVLEAAPELPRRTPPEKDRTWLLPVSAQDEKALDEVVAAYDTLLADEVELADVCFTAAVRRTHFGHRLAVTGRTARELREQLAASGSNRGVRQMGQAARVAFVFSGQGAQWWAMGRELLSSEPVFRAAVERIGNLLREYADWSLLDELLADEAHSRLDQTEVAQPTIFAVQVAMAELWRHWGIVPEAVIGHSVGEIAAAHVAGVLGLEDAVRVVFHRARLMQAATGLGSMAALELGPEAVAEIIAEHADAVAIGAINSRSQTVISGATRAVETIVEAARARGVRGRPLGVNYAFHSPQMAPFARELTEALEGLTPGRPTATLISTVTGVLATEADYGAEYWGRNVRQTVRFAEAVDALAVLEPELTAVVEIGAHPVLGAAVSEVLTARGVPAVVVPSARRGASERDVMFSTLGRLYARGCQVAWDRLYPKGQISALPMYPWQRQRYWLEPKRVTSARGAMGHHPLLGERVRAPGLTDIVFHTQLSTTQPAFLGDHRLHGQAVVPATAYIEAVLAAAETAFGAGPYALADIELVAPLRLADAPVTVQVHLREAADRTFEVFSLQGVDDWVSHARGRIVPGATTTPLPVTPPAAIAVGLESVSRATHYANLARRGLDFGPAFQGVRSLAVGEDIAIGALEVESGATYTLAPAVLDACLQPLLALLPAGADMYLPLSIERVHMAGRLTGETWAIARIRPRLDSSEARLAIGDVQVVDAQGTLLVAVEGVALRRVPAGAFGGEQDAWVRQPHWQAEPLNKPMAAADGRWLLLSDTTGVGERLAEHLRARGGTVELATRGTDVGRLVAEVCAAGPLRGIAYLWPLDLPDADGELTPGAEEVVGADALRLVQAVVEHAPSARLSLITRGARAAKGHLRVAPEQAALWGLANTARIEHPALGACLVDLDATEDAERAARQLVQELLSARAAERVAWRQGERFVEQPAGVPPRQAVGVEARPRRLEIDQRGTLEALRLHETERRAPGPCEVEVRVRASGLNFRDVLNALGLYPGEAGALGGECAGEVVRIGSGVTSLSVGDRVFGIASGTFADFAIAAADLLVRMPTNLSFEAAASVPVAFLTASEALEHVAGLRPGERVLVHAAAGGVGLAAVEIAQRLGAEIFATAGSEAKRTYLRGLGVAHVFDSRSLDFPNAILAQTDGRGVDVVLNSLAGEFIPASLRALASSGRFVEIGKRDIWTPEQVKRVRPDAQYTVIYLGENYAREPKRTGAALRRLVEALQAGALRPLPRRVFGLDNAVDAFRYMAQARHIGKVVLHVASDAQPMRLADAILPDATYLVTGGTGGIGRHLATWLVERGARHVLLISRRGAQTPETIQTVAALRQSGVQVELVQADAANYDDLKQGLARAATSMPPLRGVFHAAGVVDDGVMLEQDGTRLARVMAPKAAGAWHLHRLTRDLPLDHFVMFSSVAATFGSAGQATYAAANAYLDGLAHRRRAEGLPALSIGWGAWAATGMTAALGEIDTQRLARRGLVGMPPEQALERMGGVPVYGPPHVLIAHLAGQASASAAASTVEAASHTPTAPGLLKRWAATPAVQRRALLVDHIHAEVRRVLGLPASQAIGARQPFNELGLDSLGAVELRNALGTSLDCTLPATLLFDRPTTETLVAFLLGHVPALKDTSVPEAAEHVRPSRNATHLEDLSEAEAEALLLAELDAAPSLRSTAAR